MHCNVLENNFYFHFSFVIPFFFLFSVLFICLLFVSLKLGKKSALF